MRDKDNDLVVIKANELIQQYKYTLSKTEMRVVNTIISNIKSPKYDQDLNIMEFDINEFCHMLGLNNGGGANYKILRKTLYDLSNKSSDYIDFGEYETIVRWIERPIFEKGTGTVKLKLDDYLKPFLLQATGSIQAKLKYYFQMDSKYGMRLYELMKSYDGFDYKKIEIDELKASIDAIQKSYNNFAKFRQAVLEPAIEEINKVTDLEISYKTINRGKKVTHVEFRIKKKNVRQNVIESTGREVTSENELVSILKKYKISTAEAEKFKAGIKIKLKESSVEIPEGKEKVLIEKILGEFLSRTENKEIEKISAYLAAMINNEDWSSYKGKIEEILHTPLTDEEREKILEDKEKAFTNDAEFQAALEEHRRKMNTNSLNEVNDVLSKIF